MSELDLSSYLNQNGDLDNTEEIVSMVKELRASGQISAADAARFLLTISSINSNVANEEVALFHHFGGQGEA